MTEDAKEMKHDVVIVGAGLAGLKAALELSQDSDVAVITKVSPVRAQSVMAQGGINAALSPKDSVKQHIKDTVVAGDFLVDQDAAEVLCTEAPKAIHELDSCGALFNRTKEGGIAQRPFGAQSSPRTCFASDRTGLTLVNTLYEQCMAKKVKFYEECLALSLVVQDKRCTGLVAFDMKNGETYGVSAKAVLLTTGGYGSIYKTTTNQPLSTGDGQAMVLRAGLPLKDMEFVQFHPTGLYPNGILITEAARGEGGLLLNRSGKRFMQRYSKNGELASRDIVARAIATEIKKGRGAGKKKDHVLLDLRKLGEEKIMHRLPQLYEMAMKIAGIDCTKEPIPVAPSAHYSMGGIPVTLAGEVVRTTKGKTLPGLYAAGECACVSVHGANRVGGNSLLETVVFGKRAAASIKKYIAKAKNEKVPDAEVENSRIFIEAMLNNEGKERLAPLLGDLKGAMQDGCGVFRKERGMKQALKKIKKLKDRFVGLKLDDNTKIFNTTLMDALQFSNQLIIAEVVVESALARKESRGAHYRTDKQKRDDIKWLKHTLAFHNPAGVTIEHVPVTIKKIRPEKR